MNDNRISLCHCGDCQDAFDAAMRFAKKEFRLGEDGSCHLWVYAVASALYTIALDTITTGSVVYNHGDTPTGILQAMEITASIDHVIGQTEDKPHNKKARADFVCEAFDTEAMRSIIMGEQKTH